MSKRKSRRERQRKRRDIHSDSPLPEDFDRRAMEKSMADIGKLLSEQEFESIDDVNAFLQQTLASGQPIPTSGSRTPLEQAQDIMYEAWEASGSQRVKLARKALSISEDCADAYVLLAEEAAKSLEEAKNYYEQGVKAGERALGPEAFEEDVGHFWGILETRPYMRARAGLASCLWTMGEHQEAIEHCGEMLRLNPGDNQGMRDVLINWLLAVDDEEGAGELLDRYDDGMATWLYSRALWLFRKEGAGEEATAKLKEAVEHNPFVPPYLLGRKKLPRQLPPYMGFGDENEAVHYAASAQGIWQKDREALVWLRDTVEQIG